MSRASHTTHTTRTRRLWFGRIVLIAVGFLATSAGTAWAYFSTSGSGTYGAALGGTLTAPQDFGATVTSPSQVTLHWSAPTTLPPGTYTYALGGTLGTGGTCAASMTSATTSCSVAGLTGSTAYTWTLAVAFHTWTSTTVHATATTSVTPPGLVGVGAVQTWTSPATKQVAYPATRAATDLLVLIIARSHNNTVDCPIGWTTRASVTTHTGSAHAFLRVCSLVYTGGTEATVTVPGTSQRGVSAEIAAFSDVTTTTPFDGTGATSDSGAGAATFAPGGITTTIAGDLALSVVMENDATTTVPTLTLSAAQGFTASTSGGIATSTSNAISFATKPVPTPGSVAFPTWTSTHAGLWLGASLALTPTPDPPSGSPPPAALVQSASTSSTSAAASVTLTLPTSPTAGDALSLSVALPPDGATVSTVSGGGVTWQKAAASATPAVGDTEVWDGLSSTGGSGTVTVTFSTSTPVVLANLSEWRGVATVGTSAQASGSGTSLSAGSLGTSHDDLVVSAAVTSSASGAVSVDAPFAATSSTGSVSGFSAANTVAGPSTITWSTGVPGSWEAVAVPFAPAG